MPDFSRIRRVPIVLPPMNRPVESSRFSLEKSNTQSKTMTTRKTPTVATVRTQSHVHVLNGLRRSQCFSLPNIHEKFLCEELDFDFTLMKQSKSKTTDSMRENYSIDNELKKKKHTETNKSISNRDDLIRLTTQPIINDKDKNDDIPPLIKVNLS